MKNRAAVLFELNKNLKLIELPIPDLQEGQLLIKLKYSSICRSQIMEIDGKRGKDKWLPHQLGHEGSGVVKKVGKNVKLFKPNDEVIITWIKTEGIDAIGTNIKYKKFTINSGPATTFSEYAIISENRLIKKPKFLSFQQACYFGCAIPTGTGMILNLKQKNYKKILVIGLGGIGISISIGLILKNKKFDIYEKDLNKINIIKKNKYFKNLNFISDKRKLQINNYDIVYESAGKIETIELGFRLINFTGKLIFASHPDNGKKIRLNPHDLIKGKEIFGCWGGFIKNKNDFNRLFKLFRKNKDILNVIKSKVYSFDNINLAISDMRKGKKIRPTIKF